MKPVQRLRRDLVAGTARGEWETAERNVFGWTLAALGLSVVGSVGSVSLSLLMNLKACPLCLYQRAFIMAAAAVLATGVLMSVRNARPAAVMALPAAIAGFGVAGFHEYLEWMGRLECPGGLFGLGTAPQQSLLMFALLLAVLIRAAIGRPSGPETGRLAPAAGLLLGLVFAYGAVKSAPPMPPTPSKPYDQPLEICRPPYRPAQG
jgi:hypothetical protein